ncbi:hypothetical protein ACPVPU_04690 [Sphingomonas sp. CJ99]
MQTRLSLSLLIDRVAVLARGRAALLACLWLLHFGLGIGSDAILLTSPNASLLVALASTIGQTMLIVAQIRSGLAIFSDPPMRWRIVSLILLTVVSGAGTVLGLVLLILPGIYVAARWLLAPVILIDTNATIGESLSESWRVTGSSVPTIVAALLLCSVPLIAAFGVMVVVEIEEAAESFPLTLAINAMIALWAIAPTEVALAAYDLLGETPEDAATVFD